jgi:hypothetical protein
MLPPYQNGVQVSQQHTWSTRVQEKRIIFDETLSIFGIFDVYDRVFRSKLVQSQQGLLSKWVITR